MRVVFVGRDRSVPKRILLYLVTFGISRRIWLHRVNREVDGHEALGIDHRATAVLLVLPIVGPSIVAYRLARRVGSMLEGSEVPFRHPRLVYFATWVPILGNIFYIGWVQSRLNRFWIEERAHPEHGIEIDVGLESDPKFRAEIGKALRRSYYAGSRFDRRGGRVKARAEATLTHLAEVIKEREAVREAGGSTPMLPWLAPRLEPKRILHLTCGRCEHTFDVVRDPLAQTPIVCPDCGLSEILPSVRGDVPERVEPVAVPTVVVACPKCAKRFHSVRNLHGPTTLSCPQCGKTEVLDPPARTAKAAQRATGAKGAKATAATGASKGGAGKRGSGKDGAAKKEGTRRGPRPPADGRSS